MVLCTAAGAQIHNRLQMQIPVNVMHRQPIALRRALPAGGRLHGCAYRTAVQVVESLTHCLHQLQCGMLSLLGACSHEYLQHSQRQERLLTRYGAPHPSPRKTPASLSMWPQDRSRA